MRVSNSTYPYILYERAIRCNCTIVIIITMPIRRGIQVLSGATARIRDGVLLIKEELDWSPELSISIMRIAGP